MKDPVESPSGVNLVIVAGRCSGPCEVRVLPSGSVVANLALSAPRARGGATSVPVAVWDPPTWVEAVAEGDELVVVGHVRRRFWRTATGATASRVEVEAEAVARRRDRRRVANLLRRSGASLADLDA